MEKQIPNIIRNAAIPLPPVFDTPLPVTPAGIILPPADTRTTPGEEPVPLNSPPLFETHATTILKPKLTCTQCRYIQKKKAKAQSLLLEKQTATNLQNAIPPPFFDTPLPITPAGILPTPHKMNNAKEQPLALTQSLKRKEKEFNRAQTPHPRRK